MPQRDKVLKALRELVKPLGFHIAQVWNVEDIHELCREFSIQKLTDDEALEVLELVSEECNHQCGEKEFQLRLALMTYLSKIEA